jgi:hypothetical protein
VTMLWCRMESFMNKGMSALQCEHRIWSVDDGAIASSPSQARHWKCTIGVMKALVLMLFLGASVQAQSIADVARKERERQAKLRPSQVITSTEPAVKAETPNSADATNSKEASKDAPKVQAPPPIDPVQLWNNQLNQLRAKIRTLQDLETALMLQENQATNQVYAPVTDPATQQRAFAQLGDIQQKLVSVRKDLEDAKRQLDAMQLQGPPSAPKK